MDHSLRHLLEAGVERRVANALKADPGAADRPLPDGTPPLHLALTSEKGTGLVPLLLDHGMDPRAVDRLGRTALHATIENRRTAAARLLIERGAEIDVFAAAGLGDFDRLSDLLAEDPGKARAAQADGVTPLFYAAWAGDKRSAAALMDAGADVSPIAMRWWACLTPLHLALQCRWRAVTDLLLALRRRSERVRAPSPAATGRLPLHAAARWGRWRR